MWMVQKAAELCVGKKLQRDTEENHRTRAHENSPDFITRSF